MSMHQGSLPLKGPRTATSRSIVTRVAAITLTTLGIAALFVTFKLSQHERERLVHGKKVAAVMVSELLASSLGPALDFDDTAAAEDLLAQLRSLPEFVYAAVWRESSSEPVAEVPSPGPPIVFDETLRRTRERVTNEHIDLVNPVLGPDSRVLGHMLLRVSLTAENEVLIAARWRILLWSSMLALGLGLVLMLAMKRTVIVPLERLARAANSLALGRRPQIAIARQDEIGELTLAFNTMSEAISIREEKLEATTRYLQGLLDHMRQAIIVFGPFGLIGKQRSRAASGLFGEAARSGTVVTDLLYPESSATPIERNAFEEWLTIAFAENELEWERIAELAPREVTLQSPDQDEIVLELEFRRLERDGNFAIMLLATDTTAHRRLARSIEQREREHLNQIALMRRLLAGGAQSFVRFLEVASRRVSEGHALVAEGSDHTAGVVNDLFRHVHTLRAEARCFALVSVERELERLEAVLVAFRSEPDVDRWPETCEVARDSLAKIEELLAEARALFIIESPIGDAILDQFPVSRADIQRLGVLTRGRDDELARLASRLAARPFGECTVMLMESAPRWAERVGKRVELYTSGKEILISEELALKLGGVLAHLVRNAIAHGIEGADDRERRGKPGVGRIGIHCTEVDHGPVIEVMDDGAGFDFDALRARAAELDLNTSEALELAFKPGVSTASEEVRPLAGQGMGLAAVQADLAEIQFEIRVVATSVAGSKVRINRQQQREA